AFDDHTPGSFGPIRPIAIRAVLDELAAAGVSRSQVRLVCANALHRMCRPAELTRLLDEALVAEFGPRLSCHDAEDAAQIADLGATAEHGYPVDVSRLVTDADLTVYVNTNYIRGFTGGWKSVCVGLSTWRSIRVTHDPDGMSMSLQRNRMHAVLDEMGHHLDGARISGRHDRRRGQAGLHRRHGGRRHRRVGPRASPVVSGRVGARARQDARSVRDQCALRGRVRAPRGAYRRIPAPLRLPP